MGSYSTMSVLSVVLTDLGQVDEALHWARRAMRLDAVDANAYFHVGYPLLSLGDDPTTRRFLTRAEGLFSGAHRVQILLSALDLLTGDEQQALARARRTAASVPNVPEATNVLAALACVTGAPDAIS